MSGSDSEGSASGSDSGKRGQTAFDLFLKDKRDEVVKSKPDAAFGEVKSTVQGMWKKADESVKAVRSQLDVLVEFRCI